MRVNRPPALAGAREERGAVLVITALVLLVLLGFLALVIDLGGMLIVKRRVVAAADAAALAAAQACAGEEGARLGPGVAETRADEFARANDTRLDTGGANVLPDSTLVNCGTRNPGHVSVRYSRSVRLVVAPVLGINSGTVGAEATALWGPVERAGPVPIHIELSTVLPCVSQEASEDSPADCGFIGFDNADPNGSNSKWGYLKFPEGWDTQSCPSQSGGSGQLEDYLLENLVLDAGLDTIPTWVCSYQGNTQGGGFSALQSRVGDVVVFPVTDVPTYGIRKSSGRDIYPVVSFTPLRIIGAWSGRDARANCPDLAASTNDASLFCLRLQWEGPRFTGGPPGGDVQDLGLRGVRLTDCRYDAEC